MQQWKLWKFFFHETDYVGQRDGKSWMKFSDRTVLCGGWKYELWAELLKAAKDFFVSLQSFSGHFSFQHIFGTFLQNLSLVCITWQKKHNPPFLQDFSLGCALLCWRWITLERKARLCHCRGAVEKLKGRQSGKWFFTAASSNEMLNEIIRGAFCYANFQWLDR